MTALAPVLPRTSDRRLRTWMFIMNAALLTCSAGFRVIFIPDQVQRHADPEDLRQGEGEPAQEGSDQQPRQGGLLGRSRPGRSGAGPPEQEGSQGPPFQPQDQDAGSRDQYRA